MTNAYVLESDDDGHYYVIPATKHQAFLDWLDLDPDFQVSDTWAEYRIDNPNYLTFENPHYEGVKLYND